MTDDLNDRLERWGSAPTPRPDGAFANRLEADLRELADGGSAAPAPGLLERLLRPGAIVVAAALLVGFFAIVRSDPAVAVEMVAAEGTTVSIPGQERVTDGAAGLALPEGSRIDVGPGGSAIVAGVVLEAGSTALITDGRVEIVDAGPSRTDVPPADTDRPTTTARDAVDPDRTAPTTVGPDAAPSSSATDSGSTVTSAPPGTTDPPRTTTTEGDRGTTAAPTTTIDDDRSSTTTTSPTTAPPTSTTDAPIEPQPVPDDLRIVLEVSRVRDGQATLFWGTRGDASAIAGWVVRAQFGDRSEVLAVIRQPDVRRLRVTVPDGPVEFRVIARDEAGEVVAASRLVAPPG